MALLRLSMRVVTVLVFLALASALYPQGQPSESIIRVGVNLVRVPARVVGESGDPVCNLRPVDFQILEDGREQRLAMFGSDRDPVFVALVIDTSFSTAQQLPYLRQAAQKFAAQFGPEDQIGVYEAGPEVVRLLPFSKDREKLGHVMENLATVREFESLAAQRVRGSKILKRNTGRGGTLLYDALALVRGDFPAQTDRRILIAFTDGWDSGSDTEFSDVQAALLAGNEQFFAVLVKTPEAAPGPVWGELAAELAPRLPQLWSVVFDVRTAQKNTLPRLEGAAKTFLQQMASADRAKLFVFDGKLKPLLPQGALTRGRLSPMTGLVALEALGELQVAKKQRRATRAKYASEPGEKTMFLTAGDQADAGDFARGRTSGRMALVNVDDFQSAADTRDAMNLLLRDPDGTRKVMAQAAVLRGRQLQLRLPQLALDTGGNSFQIEKGEELGATYENIAFQIRSSYALAYYTRPQIGRREIQVAVRNPGFRVYARRAVILSPDHE